MIEKLALNHDTWVRMAKSICKDAYLADDLVSEMYLKFSEYDKDKEVNEFYVYFAIKHLWIHWMNNEKKYHSESIEDLDLLIFDEESKIHNAEIPKVINWVEKQILLLRQNKSGREIARQYNINYGKVYRIEKEATIKLKAWAEENQKIRFKDLEML